MPASLAAVKRRIDSTKSTRQITAAMQMVSTAKLNQIQHHTTTYQVYADKVKSILASLVKSHAIDSMGANNGMGSLFHPRDVKKTGILVITSDRGLVGSYNSSIIKATLDLMRQKNLTAENTVFLTVGRTGLDFFKKRGMNVAYEYTGVSDVPTYTEVRDIVQAAVSRYQNGEFDELYLAFSHYVNRISSEVITEKFLPISATDLIDETPAEQAADALPGAEYEIEPSVEEFVEMVVPQYAQSLIYGSILDAKTSEHSSSSNAMSSATDNADDIIGTLQLQYNRARQAAITTEITEITGGMTAQE
ncbi:F0F1 ATP synthase subunit gamma [Limosilactobacillus equigenerosi]|uniref:ATP synthase gamma chain n=1 Tax=Limosilactobacillus equigenerosi DSM 18793 = JCM 14505 TaxID=1423742 RepID=A0A0R1UTJ0_9LACO|nr:F0F1 ATP synthase subunit gamma [Limosilactobacillus equigenerosi]KRL96509.1 ATP synthase gamma chain [Limosilactobacillus equigenerosi DSM 18793 = JCM 14505]